MKQKTAKEMSPIVAAYQVRTGSKKAFCLAHQIAEHTLDYWRRKLSASPEPSASIGSFVSIKVDSPVVDMSYEFIFSNGNRLKAPPNLPLSILQELIKTHC